MNTLMDMLTNFQVQRMGWTLLHSLWQGAVIGVTFALVKIALQRRSANARYWVGCGCLLVMVIAAVVTWMNLAPPPLQQGTESLPTTLMLTTEAGLASGPAVAAFASGTGFVNFFQSLGDVCETLAPWITVVWIIGVVFFLVRLGQACLWVRTVRSRELDAMEDNWRKRLDGLRQRVGISRPVLLFKSALVEVPTVVGWLRPVILLPAATVAGLSPAQLEAILVHELAHVKRFDYLVNAGQCLVETLMFYHPVVWWISREIRAEREHCCDDLVVRVCEDRVNYARALATLEGLRGNMPSLALAATNGSLLQRIRRLVGGPNKTQNSPRQSGGLALAGLGMILVAIGVGLLFGPAMFDAEARLSISVAELKKTSSGSENHEPYDFMLLNHEVEIIRSPTILNQVIEELQLRQAWGKRFGDGRPMKQRDVVELLKKRLNIQLVLNTSLLDIHVISENPEEAARLANQVCIAYKTFRQQQWWENTSASLDQLSRAFGDQEAKVREEEGSLEKLRQKIGLSLAETAGASFNSGSESGSLRRLEELKADQEIKCTGSRTLLANLRAIPPGDLRRVLPRAVSDPILQELLNESVQAEQKLVAVSNDFAPEHPEAKKARAVVGKLNAQIDDEVAGIMKALASQLEIAEASWKGIEAERQRIKGEQAEKEKASAAYFDQKRQLENLKRYSALLAEKVANERVNAVVPTRPVAEVVESATVPTRRTSLRHGAASACIGLGGVMMVAGLLMAGLRPNLKLS